MPNKKVLPVESELQCSTERLQAFLYLLLRDKLNFGAVEAIIDDIEKIGNNRIVYSAPVQAAYALATARRLLWEQ